jgi:hypothetical protein
MGVDIGSVFEFEFEEWTRKVPRGKAQQEGIFGSDTQRGMEILKRRDKY